MHVRLARQTELAEGQKLLKESHGRKLLLVRSKGQVYCSDAHCFHMGGALWQGDIEDYGGAACIVCPVHRYRIDLATGQRMEKDLCGNVCSSGQQQQRTYTVHNDGEFIWVDLPDLNLTPRLPSDLYNQVAPTYQQQSTAVPAAPTTSVSAGVATPPRQSYGLAGFGGTASQADSAGGLTPYAGVTRLGAYSSPPQPEGQQEDASMQLSQESVINLSQESQASAPSPQQAPQQQQFHFQQQQQHYPGLPQGRISFPQARADPPHIARRKAATAAIMNKYREPPMAPGATARSAAPAPRGLASTSANQASAAPVAPAAPAPAAAAAPRAPGGQQSLFSFGFTTAPRPPPAVPASGGTESMDMDF